jgi:hypothetical protein
VLLMMKRAQLMIDDAEKKRGEVGESRPRDGPCHFPGSSHWQNVLVGPTSIQPLQAPVPLQQQGKVPNSPLNTTSDALPIQIDHVSPQHHA